MIDQTATGAAMQGAGAGRLDCLLPARSNFIRELSPDAAHRRIAFELPFAGARMLAKLLRREGQPIGCRHVSALMKRTNIRALYRKPNTSKRHPAHKVYPLPAT
jgi:hypothetical protein